MNIKYINEKVQVYNEDGSFLEYNVLFTFDSLENNKTYVGYTDGKLDDNRNKNLFVSYLDNECNDGLLKPISKNDIKVLDKFLVKSMRGIKNGRRI